MYVNIPLSAGVRVEEDCGYRLLSALTQVSPGIHGCPEIQIAPVRGSRAPNGWLRTDAKSVLHIRGPEEVIRPLSGAWVTIYNNRALGLGRMVEVQPVPAPTLVSRMVIFEGAVDPSDFLQKLASRVPIGASFTLNRRRTVVVKGRTFIGYGVRLEGLSPEQSLYVQEHGIGKFTSMGCGVFAPARDQR